MAPSQAADWTVRARDLGELTCHPFTFAYVRSRKVPFSVVERCQIIWQVTREEGRRQAASARATGRRWCALGVGVIVARAVGVIALGVGVIASPGHPYHVDDGVLE